MPSASPIAADELEKRNRILYMSMKIVNPDLFIPIYPGATRPSPSTRHEHPRNPPYCYGQAIIDLDFVNGVRVASGLEFERRSPFFYRTGD
jgi:hypothetical protein